MKTIAFLNNRRPCQVKQVGLETGGEKRVIVRIPCCAKELV